MLILHEFTDKVRYTAELACDESLAEEPIKLISRGYSHWKSIRHTFNSTKLFRWTSAVNRKPFNKLNLGKPILHPV